MLPVFSVLYGIALHRTISLLDVNKPWVVRLLAVASNRQCFYISSGSSVLFTGFTYWYQSGMALEAISLLTSALR